MELPSAFSFDVDDPNMVRHDSGVLRIQADPLSISLTSGWSQVLPPEELTSALVAYVSQRQLADRRQPARDASNIELRPSGMTTGQAIAIMEELKRLQAAADARLAEAEAQASVSSDQPTVTEIKDDEGSVTAVLLGSLVSNIELPHNAETMAASALSMRLTNVVEKALNVKREATFAPDTMQELEAIRREVGLIRH